MDTARSMSGCDAVIVCLNGSVSQRGDVMIMDKWIRARDALLAGADMVVELPALFAVRPADRFALGGVSVLSGIGIDELAFGCEPDSAGVLTELTSLMDDPPERMRHMIRQRLDAGESLARARGGAAETLLSLPDGYTNRPNMILAIEYIRALRQVGRPVSLCVVPRQGAYHDPEPGRCASASAVRRLIAQGQDTRCAGSMPEHAYQSLLEARAQGRLASDARLDPILIYLLRNTDEQTLNGILGADEGMELLLKKHAALCGDRASLIDRAKCKRYTNARLNRFCASLLLGMTKTESQKHPTPTYARVLGFRRGSSWLFRELERRAALPIVTDPMRLRDDPIFAFDRAATDLQALAREDPACRTSGDDLTRPIVIV